VEKTKALGGVATGNTNVQLAVIVTCYTSKGWGLKITAKSSSTTANAVRFHKKMRSQMAKDQ
jgi:hypothetical protein